MNMKYLIFLCLFVFLFFSCAKEKDSEFYLKRKTLEVLNQSYLSNFSHTQEYIIGYKQVCEGDFYNKKQGRPHIQCKLYDDMRSVHRVFENYLNRITKCEEKIGVSHEKFEYFDCKIVDSFPNKMFRDSFKKSEKEILIETIKNIDPFFDSLTELFIKVLRSSNDLGLYDLALRHNRREALKEIKGIYDRMPVYIDDQSMYEEAYQLGINYDYITALDGLDNKIDFLLVLYNLKLELSRLEYMLIRHIRSRMGYGGPTSTVFEPEILIEGPDKVKAGEEFTLFPRHVYLDMWEVNDFEFGEGMLGGKFRIKKDTLIKGTYKMRLLNGRWLKIPFEKCIEVYKD